MLSELALPVDELTPADRETLGPERVPVLSVVVQAAILVGGGGAPFSFSRTLHG